MSIELGKDCHRAATFVDQHANAHLPANAPNPLPPGHLVVGNDFFTVKTKDALQTLIDSTYNNRKKFDFDSPAAGLANAAKDLLQRASSSSHHRITIKWGIHQSQNRPNNDPGITHHFTIAISGPNDWHLYVNRNGGKISYMSNGAGPLNLVAIKRF